MKADDSIAPFSGACSERNHNHDMAHVLLVVVWYLKLNYLCHETYRQWHGV